MKYVIQNTIALVFILCFNQQICAQLLQNGDFEAAQNCPSSPCNGRLTPNCCPNWHRSHGTARVVTSSGTNYCYMAYSTTSNNTGEGVFYNYNFVQGRSYRLCIDAKTIYFNCNQPAPGIVIRAANGVPETSSDGSVSCFEAIPNPTNSQVILTDNTTYSNWTEITVTFTANANYSQLWIYPQATDCEIDLSIDDVAVTDITCTPLVIAGNQQVSAGIYNHHNTIIAGGQIVSIAPSANVEFWASDYVLLAPDFVSTPNIGNYFLAAIRPCDPLCPLSKTGKSNSDAYKNVVDEESVALTLLMVNPNPFNNQSTITYSLNRTAPIEMQVFDINGKMVWQKLLTDKEKGEHSLQLNLTGFPAGVYFLNAIVDGKNYNKKLILTN